MGEVDFFAKLGHITGRKKRALDRSGWRTASQVPGAEEFATYCHALLALKLGDQAGYRRDCAAQIKRLVDAKEISREFAGDPACILAPNPGTDLNSLLPLLERRVLEYPHVSQYLSTWGQVLYRAGQWEAAVQRLNEAVGAAPQFKPTRPPSTAKSTTKRLSVGAAPQLKPTQPPFA